MTHWRFKDVNEAFENLVHFIHYSLIQNDTTVEEKPSRAGDVIQVNEPVMVTYDQPTKRVLLNSARDANPFFHLYEALWMLTGRDDVEPLKYYNSNIADIASDNGETFNGAYGYRWRNAIVDESAKFYKVVDQIELLVRHLKENPFSRRAVLQMWNVEDDLLKIDDSKDVCCNTCVYFSISPASEQVCIADRIQGGIGDGAFNHVLDMTVSNRSNDLIWGMLGANVVHFSILQEYMAAKIKVGVGKYHHFTNNLHVYKNNWKPEEWLKAQKPEREESYNPHFLVSDIKTFDEELPKVVAGNYKALSVDQMHATRIWKEPFFNGVAQPMFNAYHCYKRKEFTSSLSFASTVKDEAWREVSLTWLEKRIKRAGNFRNAQASKQ